jgi:hypothetical protein
MQATAADAYLFPALRGVIISHSPEKLLQLDAQECPQLSALIAEGLSRIEQAPNSKLDVQPSRLYRYMCETLSSGEGGTHIEAAQCPSNGIPLVPVRGSLHHSLAYPFPDSAGTN